jgi:hypothetical protein
MAASRCGMYMTCCRPVRSEWPPAMQSTQRCGWAPLMCG